MQINCVTVKVVIIIIIVVVVVCGVWVHSIGKAIWVNRYSRERESAHICFLSTNLLYDCILIAHDDDDDDDDDYDYLSPSYSPPPHTILTLRFQTFVD